ncbi:MAG: UbiX family flavin prenyltransferase [Candidatus Kuenenia sp.]|nr:UbiX family flavin prenyltransferase [Candidatus Kuenenia hertensis]
MENIVVGITGASGVVYAQRFLQALLTKKDIFAHVSISEAALRVIHHELGIDLNYEKPNFEELLGIPADKITYYNNSNISTTIASSQYPIKAMIIVPCSMNTLCSIAHGIASNLIQRVASVTIKERRKLVLVPRETPLSSIHLEAMLKLSSVGTCILPAMPGFYHNPGTLNDQVDFVVAKILDMLGIKHSLIPIWQSGNDKSE